VPGRLAVAAGFAIGLLAAIIFFGSGADAQEAEEGLPENEYCLSCHGQPGMQTTLPSGEVLDLTFDVEAFEASVHGGFDIPCVLCHTDISEFPHDPITAVDYREFAQERADACVGCHLAQYEEAADSVHAAARAAGHPEAAVCTDCHGAHDTFRPEPHSTEVPLTCRTCHAEIYDLYEESVHGEALTEGNRDVPTCTDCHGVHDLEGPSKPQFHLFSPQICAECHADEEMMDRYGISTEVFDTYVADFHGSTVVLFEQLAPDQETNKPVCIDCHGVHAIKSEDDPDSTVFKSNILQTCQRCHPDATENFPGSWLSHYVPTASQAPIVFGVTLFYRIFIPLIIGGMALFVVLDVVRSISRRRRGHGDG
jgi:nitrate/TMAO reductase-like tetraheme cytochrome c subunit